MDGWNYFNYFTEIEEYFWKKRGAHLLVSPLDWAIMETWQKAGVPLEAVLKGIDRVFESYGRSRRGWEWEQLPARRRLRALRAWRSDFIRGRWEHFGRGQREFRRRAYARPTYCGYLQC